MRARAERLRDLLPAVLLTAVAAALSWQLAKDVIGHPTPFFAPIAAIVALGTTVGQRTRRSFEIAFGVALGVLTADLIVLAIGSGVLQIALVASLAMAAAIVLGGERLTIAQAATSSVLVTTIDVPTSITFTRFVDALAGGVIAITLNLLVFPANPRRLATRHARPLIDELSGNLDAIADGLARQDHDLAVDALLRARELDARVARFGDAVRAGDETARLSPARRRHRDDLAAYARAATHIDHAVRNTRVLARASLRAVDLDAHVPREGPEALRDLARAFAALGPDLLDPRATADARAHALTAAGRAQLALERTGNLAVSHIIGQIRLLATDTLRAVGVQDDEAAQAIRAASTVLETIDP